MSEQQPEQQPEGEQLSKSALMQLESLAYHKWTVLRTEAEKAHAEYVRVADRLNNIKLGES